MGRAPPREELGFQCQRALALKVQSTDVGRAWILFPKGQSSCMNLEGDMLAGLLSRVFLVFEEAM